MILVAKPICCRNSFFPLFSCSPALSLLLELSFFFRFPSMKAGSTSSAVVSAKGSSTSLDAHVDNTVGKDLNGSVEEQPKKKISKTASYFNVLFSGFALMSDGYQSGVISFVNLLLTTIYGTEIFNATMSSRLSYAMFVGAIIGQLGKVFSLSNNKPFLLSWSMHMLIFASIWLSCVHRIWSDH